MEQRFTFDCVADLYEAARPSYPEALFDHVLTQAEAKSGDMALEIGCGTGKATQGFARRELRIVALDPGGELIRVARTALAGFEEVSFVQTTFEQWTPPDQPFRLVFAAQSLHWVPPETAFSKAARVLAPGGLFAVFGNVPVSLSPEPVNEAVERAYARHAPALSPIPQATWYLPSGPLEDLFRQSELFTSPTREAYTWSERYSAATYIANLRTASQHQLLPPEQLESLLGAISDAIADQGGEVRRDYETHLYMAARKP